MRRFVAAVLVLLAQPAFTQTPAARKVLLIVVDGLRPDYITDLMPRVSALARRGIVFRAHHSVFPTVTQ